MAPFEVTIKRFGNQQLKWNHYNGRNETIVCNNTIGNNATIGRNEPLEVIKTLKEM